MGAENSKRHAKYSIFMREQLSRLWGAVNRFIVPSINFKLDFLLWQNCASWNICCFEKW